jgi:hypothetical protein
VAIRIDDHGGQDYSPGNLFLLHSNSSELPVEDRGRCRVSFGVEFLWVSFGLVGFDIPEGLIPSSLDRTMVYDLDASP